MRFSDTLKSCLSTRVSYIVDLTAKLTPIHKFQKKRSQENRPKFSQIHEQLRYGTGGGQSYNSFITNKSVSTKQIQYCRMLFIKRLNALSPRCLDYWDELNLDRLMHLNNWPLQADYIIRYTSIKQVENIGTNAWLLDEGQIHRMNVNGPCNCQPHKI